jgi:2-dehydropantoate 2-reductase
MDPINVIGAGGIGCAVGYALRAAGALVTFVDADAAKVSWGRAHGVRVDRLPPLPASFQTFDEWAPAPGATLLLCTKCYDNRAVLDRLSGQATLVPIQNGFDHDLDGHGESPEGIASFVSECLPHQCHTRITRQGRLHFGFRNGHLRHTSPTRERGGARASLALRACEQVPAIALLQRSSLFRVEVVEDILPYKYTKLMYNAAISPLAAAAGLDNGDLLRLPTARRLFFELLRENYAILCGAGIRLGKIGPFHPHTVARILRRGWLARAFAWAFYPTLRGTYCSMSGDLPAGRTEIDYYNGHLIELAGEHLCPLNRRVHALVKRMEHEQIRPGVAVLTELL